MQSRNLLPKCRKELLSQKLNCVEEIEEDNIALMILEWDHIFWNGDAEESLFQLEKLMDITSELEKKKCML